MTDSSDTQVLTEIVDQNIFKTKLNEYIDLIIEGLKKLDFSPNTTAQSRLNKLKKSKKKFAKADTVFLQEIEQKRKEFNDQKDKLIEYFKTVKNYDGIILKMFPLIILMCPDFKTHKDYTEEIVELKTLSTNNTIPPEIIKELKISQMKGMIKNFFESFPSYYTNLLEQFKEKSDQKVLILFYNIATDTLDLPKLQSKPEFKKPLPPLPQQQLPKSQTSLTLPTPTKEELIDEQELNKLAKLPKENSILQPLQLPVLSAQEQLEQRLIEGQELCEQFQKRIENLEKSITEINDEELTKLKEKQKELEEIEAKVKKYEEEVVELVPKKINQKKKQEKKK